MKRYFFLIVILLVAFLAACNDDVDNGRDMEKVVEMTIYAEPGYGSSVLSDIWMQPLVFSEDDDTERHALLDIIVEDFDFEYQRGYEYKLKVKKIWMHNPPQDVSRIKYEFVEMLSVEKVINSDFTEDLNLTVYPNRVKFVPTNPVEYEEDGVTPKMYNALKVKNNETEQMMILPKIEGFSFQEGYEYVIDVRKHTQANPYAVSYELLNVVSKEVKEEP